MSTANHLLDHASLVGSGDVPPSVSANYPTVPPPPTRLQDTGVDPEVLANLILKSAYTVPRFSTDWVARKTCLPLQLVAELLEQLRKDHLVEVLGQAGVFNHQFAITGRGREHALRLFEISAYIGPAPVSLEAYTHCLEWQFDSLPPPSNDRISAALAEMVLPENVKQVAGPRHPSAPKPFSLRPSWQWKDHAGTSAA